MRISGLNVAVTGASGFIGSHLVERLVVEHCQVRALVRYNSTGQEENLHVIDPAARAAVEVVKGDLTDPDAVRAFLKGQDVVFHLGALIAIPYSYINPQAYFMTNVMGTVHVLNAAREHGLARVLHTSTSEVYGSARYVPIDERHPLQGQSPYAASKIGADKAAESYFNSFGLPVVTVRPFNTFGPRQSTRAVITTIIGQALARPSISLGALTPTRDMNFVLDTVDAYVKLAQCDEAIGTVTNVGSGREVSIGELARVILDILELDKPIVEDANRLRPSGSEVTRLLADNSRLQTLLGWQPHYTLRGGLELTIEWVRANLHMLDVERYGV